VTEARGLAKTVTTRRAAAILALDVNVILTPACIFHSQFSVQNTQGGVRMTLTSTPRRSRGSGGSFGRSRSAGSRGR
jgi:hypothetical protein